VGTEAAAEDLQTSTDAAAAALDTNTTNTFGGGGEEEKEGIQDTITVIPTAESNDALIDATAVAAAAAAVPSSANRSEDLLE